MSDSTQVGALSSAQHLAKVLGFFNQAVSEGAKVLCGGEMADAKVIDYHYFQSRPSSYSELQNLNSVLGLFYGSGCNGMH